MYIGIDLGTSGVKAVLLGPAGTILGQATAPLTVATPQPLWSEQNPEDWWLATCAAVHGLGAAHDLSGVHAIGLCGQMHGAVLLDSTDRVLRPAILWNDGRSHVECADLEAAEPNTWTITGNRAMPGFTAPKLLWVRRHEPEVFSRLGRVLLPKDWLRLRLTGEAVSDMSDASGTLWLDVARRRWSRAMLAATGLSEAQMPRLVEGSAPAGTVRPDAAAALGIPAGCAVAGGAGDNAAGAVGIGCISAGQAFLSLGTSGVIFVADPAFRPAPERAVHAFCHCLPDTWHRMSVILSAASALGWAARVTGATDEASLLQEIAATPAKPRDRLVFLPYLSGERTPHNDPAASGVFFGLTTSHSRGDLGRAVLEGVAFALADGLDALEASGDRIPTMTAIGGGARSRLWLQTIANILQRTLTTIRGSEIGPALGAARLAILAREGGDPRLVCQPPETAETFVPVAGPTGDMAHRRTVFQAAYPALRPLFTRSLATPAP